LPAVSAGPCCQFLRQRLGAPDGGKSRHHLLGGRRRAVTALFSRSGSRAYPRGQVINQIKAHYPLARSIEDMRSTLIPNRFVCRSKKAKDSNRHSKHKSNNKWLR
jgi:hypothetical protein